ncbi:hypothetical protein EWM64_g2363 [Hericium alpestre]|uniref:FAD-binding domain-containing protein n=1 Tax=Hericium alpestre TaxID=135208 RepID=A0A4Z0A3Q2_9AGAM|nr:hypothetical protein EWM64_g2363 [Hericium alpestre]
MPTKVIIVGAGIAGPVLALFLKQRGYDPVIYERTPGLTDAGLSLCLQPNGLAVLAQIPGLIPSLPGQDLTTTRAFALTIVLCNEIPSRHIFADVWIDLAAVLVHVMGTCDDPYRETPHRACRQQLAWAAHRSVDVVLTPPDSLHHSPDDIRNDRS